METKKMRASFPDSCYELLISCYFWPTNMTEKMEVSPIFHFRAALFYSFVGIPIYFTFHHLIFGKRSTPDVMFSEISISITYVCFVLIGIIYMIHFKKVVSLTFNISIYLNESEEQIKLQSGQNFKLQLAQRLLILTAVAYHIIRTIHEPYCRRHLPEETIDYCGIIFPIEIPENFDYFIVRQIISVMQCTATVLYLRGILSLFSLCIATLEQINLNIRILKKSITTLRPHMPMLFYKNCFKHFAVTHSNIIRIANELNDITFYIHFVHVTCTSIQFALLIFDIYKHHNFTSGILFVGWIVALEYLTKHCQDIQDECEALCIEIYNIKWYDMDTRLRHYVQFILTASQKPIVIPAGPFVNLCTDTLMKLLQMASSYMTMLINLQP